MHNYFKKSIFILLAFITSIHIQANQEIEKDQWCFKCSLRMVVKQSSSGCFGISVPSWLQEFDQSVMLEFNDITIHEDSAENKSFEIVNNIEFELSESSTHGFGMRLPILMKFDGKDIHLSSRRIKGLTLGSDNFNLKLDRVVIHPGEKINDHYYASKTMNRDQDANIVLGRALAKCLFVRWNIGQGGIEISDWSMEKQS